MLAEEGRLMTPHPSGSPGAPGESRCPFSGAIRSSFSVGILYCLSLPSKLITEINLIQYTEAKNYK